MTSRAYETLHRGTTFLTSLATTAALAGPWPQGNDAHVRARYMGNCLRELDRFLDTLLDENTLQSEGTGPGPGDDGAKRLSLRDTTAHKLGDHASAVWDPHFDQLRLHALNRSRVCLLHGGGRVRRPDSPRARWMTAGWCEPSSPRLRRYAMGEMLKPSGQDLAAISTFYQSLADRIVAA